MNKRLQRKCFLAAAGFHLLLLVILLVGPAFLSGRKTEDRPLIDFVPLKTIDEALSGGGNPNARPPVAQPQPQPQPPAPQPQPRVQSPAPQPQPRQETPKPTPREREPDPPKPTRTLPDVSLKPWKGKNPSQKNPAKQPSPKKDDRATQIAKAAQNAANSIRNSVSDSAVDMPELQGPVGGGIPYANFLDAIKRIYTDAWIVPDGVTDDEATGTASVTIARDGTVKEARLIRSSGNALADQSVQMVLRRVKFAVPLPEGSKDPERTVTIKFNVKAKRGSG